MHAPVRELMQALANSIKADEAFADYFARVAAGARDIDQPGIAVASAAHARLHRVKAIKLRARLGALVEQYGALHIDSDQK